jgi:heme oxygenase (biliverdin-producing, ferredoxin)
VLHARAERSGVVNDILRGRVSLAGYALFLRNLLPVYEQLELGLESQRGQSGLKEIALSAVYRLPAIQTDLASMCGADWEQCIPRLPSSARYADRIAQAAQGDGTRLLAHAYTRYLGDLNGGPVLARKLSLSLSLESRALGFYAYPRIADLEKFARQYRSAFDRAGVELADWESVLQEAETAFLYNIELSEEAQLAASSPTHVLSRGGRPTSRS